MDRFGGPTQGWGGWGDWGTDPRGSGWGAGVHSPDPELQVCGREEMRESGLNTLQMSVLRVKGEG